MLIAILIYLLIGALFMGGIMIANTDLADMFDSYMTESDTINCIIGMLSLFAISMIWLIAVLVVIIKLITDNKMKN